MSSGPSTVKVPDVTGQSAASAAANLASAGFKVTHREPVVVHGPRRRGHRHQPGRRHLGGAGHHGDHHRVERHPGHLVDQPDDVVVDVDDGLTTRAVPVRRSARGAAAVIVLLAAALLAVACSSGSGTSGTSGASATKHPNIVFILSDDQRWDTIQQMPWLSSQTDWAKFTNSFVNDPQCCPSRATTLTGRYTQHTGVETLGEGGKLNEKITVATMLHSAGYHTGLFGKYLNDYPFNRGDYVPPGWDTFDGYIRSTTYYNYKLNENGKSVSYGSKPAAYSTDVLAAMARTFIAKTPKSQPVFLYLPFNAPHYVGVGWAVPAPRDKYTCLDLGPDRPPSYNVVDPANSPPWLMGTAPQVNWIMDSQRKAVCQTLVDVDRQLESIVAELKATGRLDDTYIMYASDNGYSYGEHRLIGKGDLYEESIRVPLMVKGPGIDARSIDRLTSNVDWTPTILDWAGVKPPPHFVDGSSFAGNLRGEAGTSPSAVLLRGCRTTKATTGDNNQEDSNCGGYPTGFGLDWGLRTAQYAYVEYPDGFRELYDIRTDPFELVNLASDPAHAAVVADLHTRLLRLEQS